MKKYSSNLLTSGQIGDILLYCIRMEYYPLAVFGCLHNTTKSEGNQVIFQQISWGFSFLHLPCKIKERSDMIYG